jgi:hypothetical protein
MHVSPNTKCRTLRHEEIDGALLRPDEADASVLSDLDYDVSMVFQTKFYRHLHRSHVEKFGGAHRPDVRNSEEHLHNTPDTSTLHAQIKLIHKVIEDVPAHDKVFASFNAFVLL